MTIKNPYSPPNYGMVSTAIERRIAGETPVAAEEAPKKAPAKKKGAA